MSFCIFFLNLGNSFMTSFLLLFMTFSRSLCRVWCLPPSLVTVTLRTGNVFKNKSVSNNSGKYLRCAQGALEKGPGMGTGICKF